MISNLLYRNVLQISNYLRSSIGIKCATCVIDSKGIFESVEMMKFRKRLVVIESLIVATGTVAYAILTLVHLI